MPCSPLSRAIDAMSERIGRLVYWLILAVVLISATNATVRKAFNYSSNAYLEIQWYLFSRDFPVRRRVRPAAQRACAHRHHLGTAFRAGAELDRRRSVLVFFLFPMAFVIMWFVVAAVHGFVHPQRGVDQRRRPHHLAGASHGADRLLPADRSGRIRADQAHRVPAGQDPRSAREDSRQKRRGGVGRRNCPPAWARTKEPSHERLAHREHRAADVRRADHRRCCSAIPWRSRSPPSVSSSGLVGIELGLLQPTLFQALPERVFGVMSNDTLLARAVLHLHGSDPRAQRHGRGSARHDRPAVRAASRRTRLRGDLRRRAARGDDRRRRRHRSSRWGSSRCRSCCATATTGVSRRA